MESGYYWFYRIYYPDGIRTRLGDGNPQICFLDVKKNLFMEIGCDYETKYSTEHYEFVAIIKYVVDEE